MDFLAPMGRSVASLSCSKITFEKSVIRLFSSVFYSRLEFMPLSDRCLSLGIYIFFKKKLYENKVNISPLVYLALCAVKHSHEYIV